MKLEQVRFVFDNVTVIWEFDLSIAPDYGIKVINNVSGLEKQKAFKTAKQPTVYNAWKFAEE